MIDRHWFILLIGLIGSINPRIAFAILFAYMVFLKSVEQGWVVI